MLFKLPVPEYVEFFQIKQKKRDLKTLNSVNLNCNSKSEIGCKIISWFMECDGYAAYWNWNDGWMG